MGLHFDFSKESESSYRDVKRTTLVELLDVVDSLPYRSEGGVKRSELLNNACIFQEMIQGIELALVRPLNSDISVVLIGFAHSSALVYGRRRGDRLLGSRMDASLSGVRDSNPHRSLHEDRQHDSKALHHKLVHHSPHFAVRFSRPSGARIPQNGHSPNLRKAHKPPRHDSQRYQQHLLHVSLRDKASQRDFGAPRDPRVDHQRVHDSDSPRTPPVPREVAHSAPQNAAIRRVQRASLLLHDALRAEGLVAQHSRRILCAC